MIVTTSPRTASTDTRKSWGYSIAYCPVRGAWFGNEWERVTCLHVHSTPATDAMTEAEARAWLERDA
jgi:hypothetical protein